MISNSACKIQGKSRINSVMFVLLTALYTIAYNNHFRANTILWFGCSILVIVVIIFDLFLRKRIRLTFISGWAVAVYTYFLLSMLWAKESSFSDPMKSLALIFTTVILLSSFIETKEDLERLFLANYLALLFCAIYVITAVDVSQLGVTRISSSMEGLWNSNAIGVMMCSGFIQTIYYFIKTKKPYIKASLVAFAALFVILVFNCGSRSGFLLMLLSIELYILVNAKGFKVVRAIILSTALILIIFTIIMNYEPIYNVLGKRLEDLVDGLFGNGTKDGSFNERYFMLTNGLRWFAEKPILGHGIDNFRFLLGHETGFYTYAHNNFIEMLVDVGIIGFLIYYSVYLYIVVKLWKKAFTEKDKLAIVIIVLNFARLVIQFSTITYYQTEPNTLLAIACIYISIIKSDDYQIKHNTESYHYLRGF